MQDKKRWPFCCFAFGLLLSLSVCSEPVVSNIRRVQRAGTKLVDITYDLAVDTEDVALAVSIRISKDAGATWDVPCKNVSGNGIGLEVTPGTDKSIVWDAGADWNRQLSEQMLVEIKATIVPMISEKYLVIDLSEGPEAESYPMSTLDEVPDGGWTDEYKTTKLVLRRIPAGTFTMGSPTGELGRIADRETQHQVTLTKDFYAGVFEVTQRQWYLVMGNWPSSFSNNSCRDSRPVEQVSYEDIRGTQAGKGWPSNNAVDADSFLGRLRIRTGLVFDLPTEAQWEYACRAGTTTALNSGNNLNGEDNCPNMDEVGRYAYNGGGEGNGKPGCDTSRGTNKVGSYLPNAWGLYDMHGNVNEWCLDWYGGENYSSQPVTDPKGNYVSLYRAARGGCCFSSASLCRSAYRNWHNSGSQDASYGFRLVKMVP